MTPTVICAGFRRCGVYPFNPQAIDCSISTENPEASLLKASNKQTGTEDGRVENGVDNTATEFSMEQEQRFRERFEEEYDLIDPEYLRWLEINHPDRVPADRHLLVFAPDSAGVSEDNPTLSNVFSFVQPSSPLTMTERATSPSLGSPTPHAADTHTTLESTPRASTTGLAKTPPTLESTPHVSTTESAKTSPIQWFIARHQ